MSRLPDGNSLSVAMRIASLGLLFAALGFVTPTCYALAAGTAGNWLKRSRGYLVVKRYASGVLFIGLGLITAFAGTTRSSDGPASADTQSPGHFA